MTNVVLDTGVIAEFIDLEGHLHKHAAAVINNTRAGRLRSIVPHPVLAETYYVAARLYEKTGISPSEERAEKLIEWLYKSPNFSLAEPSLELALRSGSIKHRLGLALTDAYVLAASEICGAKALFRKPEKEMTGVLRTLMDNFDIVFLEDFL